jgi:hypothetical protein
MAKRRVVYFSALGGPVPTAIMITQHTNRSLWSHLPIHPGGRQRMIWMVPSCQNTCHVGVRMMAQASKSVKRMPPIHLHRPVPVLVMPAPTATRAPTTPLLRHSLPPAESTYRQSIIRPSPPPVSTLMPSTAPSPSALACVRPTLSILLYLGTTRSWLE